MPEKYELQSMANEDGWQSKILVLGGAAGLIFGIVSAYLYVQAAAQREESDQPVGPKVGEAVRVGTVLLGVVRTITEWATR